MKKNLKPCAYKHLELSLIHIWGMRNLDVVWLGWPASFVAGTVIPYFCFQKIVREMETE